MKKSNVLKKNNKKFTNARILSELNNYQLSKELSFFQKDLKDLKDLKNQKDQLNIKD